MRLLPKCEGQLEQRRGRPTSVRASRAHIQRIPRQAITDRSVGNHVSDIGTAFYTKHDANAELQKSQPNWYGPFLEEGECYHTERSEPNGDDAIANSFQHVEKASSDELR